MRKQNEIIALKLNKNCGLLTKIIVSERATYSQYLNIERKFKNIIKHVIIILLFAYACGKNG